MGSCQLHTICNLISHQVKTKDNSVIDIIGLLVDWTVFQDTVFEFGVTGHPHFDIDQTFSRFSVSLSLGHLTVADFLERVRNGSTRCNASTEAIACNKLVNWHMASSPHVHGFSGVSRPLLFKLSKAPCCCALQIALREAAMKR